MGKKLVCLLLTAVLLSACAPGGGAFVPSEEYGGTYEGLDLELTLWSREAEEPCGLWGPETNLFSQEPEVTQEASQFPQGDVEGTVETECWDGFTRRTFVAREGAHTSEGFATVYEVICTREDVYTYRGVHVGSTLEEVLEAYPDLGYDLEEWQQSCQDAGRQGELRYTPEEYRGSLSPDLIFTLEGDAVKELALSYLPQQYEF